MQDQRTAQEPVLAEPSGITHRTGPRPAAGPGLPRKPVSAIQNISHPANLFVGGFIGSPSMNLVTARLVSDDGAAAVTFAGYRMPIPGSILPAKPGIAACSGRDVIIGIRPSDFEDASLADESWPRMAVETHVPEEIGSEIHAVFAISAPPVEHKDVAGLVPQGRGRRIGDPALRGKVPVDGTSQRAQQGPGRRPDRGRDGYPQPALVRPRQRTRDRRQATTHQDERS
ncbi:MAG TPA: hypothetical protein VFW50_45590 [Streptosporangiaceae bacterium]|nr:hypothetical protein [Streptosporangiaceae bacterium]